MENLATVLPAHELVWPRLVVAVSRQMDRGALITGVRFSSEGWEMVRYEATFAGHWSGWRHAGDPIRIFGLLLDTCTYQPQDEDFVLESGRGITL